ncbi:MAG TPA: DUF441 family protein, partial [Limnochordia bacterium]
TLVAIAAGLMLAVQAIDSPRLYTWIDDYSLPAGVVLMLLALMLPFGRNAMGLGRSFGTLITVDGILATLIGVFAAYLGAEGIRLLEGRPEVLIGLVVGTMAGVAFFHGIPIGPLVTAGAISLIYRLVGIR